jgi:hypothetical protein
VCLAATLSVLSGVAIAATPASPAVAAAPACTFNGSSLPIVTGVSTGKVVAIKCTGLAPLRPHLLFEASLLIGIDPKAKALFSGASGTPTALFPAAVATIDKINPNSIKTVNSDLNGNLNYNFVVPASMATDPNATCPPSQQQFNAGLIGCALAMVDVVTQKPVGAASAVLQWTGFPLLPPQPTVGTNVPKARAGRVVGFSSAIGATTYWWVPTLVALNSMLSGQTSTPKITVTVGSGLSKKTAVTAAWALPATYTKPTFTPGNIWGFFVMPKGLPPGPNVVTVTLVQSVLGLPLVNVASTTIKRV